MNYKQITLIVFCLIFLIFFSDNSQPEDNLVNQDSIEPYCGGMSYDQVSKLSYKDLEIIQIETPDSRGWYENLYKAQIIGNYINPKFKKYFDANISFKFTNNITCKSQAEIRLHGDFKDHIVPPFTSSLDIKLIGENIFGITRFKLFIPATRSIGAYEDFGTNSKNAANGEIFTSVVMESLGFLSPRTFYVQASVNSGNPSNFLFQEKITKEFIENNNFREGPILETNEKYVWKDSADDDYVRTNPQDGKWALEFGKVLNDNWAIRSYENFIISLEAVEKYNKAIFNSNSFREINNKMLGNNYKNIYNFEASLWALRAFHGIENTHNRKFFFNKLSSEFIPIVYDSNTQFLFSDEPYLIEEYSNFSSIVNGAGLMLSTSLDSNLVNKKLIERGLDWSIDYTEELIKKFYDNLYDITLQKVPDKDYLTIKNSLKKKRNSDALFLFTDYENSIFEICDQYLNNCYFIDKPNYKELLNDDLIYLDKSTHLIGINKENFHSDNTLEYSNEIFIDDINLKFIDEVIYRVNSSEKIITFTLNNPKSKVLVQSLEQINGWEFRVNSQNVINTNSRSDENLLTGCLTIYDSFIKNIKISSNNAHCEDAVNFISVSGSIENIDINNAVSDGLDLDFSNLKILNLNIKNAGNDCLDISAGNYDLINLILDNCKDKGLSIGEKSNAQIKNIEVVNTNLAIAIKDSSYAVINNFFGDNVEKCLNAYRKKQEFGPVKVQIKKRECAALSEDFIQKGSIYAEE